MRRKRMAYTIGGGLVVALVVLGYLLQSEWQKRFPLLPPGTYGGYVQGANTKAPFLVQHRADTQELTVLVFLPEAVVSTVVGTPSGSAGGDTILPISIIYKGSSVTFAGAAEGTDSFSGEFSGTLFQGAKGGRWTLQKRAEPRTLEPSQHTDVALWLSLRNELEGVKRQITQAELRVPIQRAEIEKLTLFVTEGERLKSRAQEKYSLVKEELTSLQKLLTEQQAEAKRLQEALFVNQKVSGMGKLVSLARDSLEREARWIDSMVRVVTPPADLDEAVAQAERVMATKREIAKERKRIDALLKGEVASSPTPEAPAAEDSPALQAQDEEEP
jgi:hypothetical protein